MTKDDFLAGFHAGAAAAPKWVSVEERLPDKFKAVLLVRNVNNKPGKIYFGELGDAGWYTLGLNQIYDAKNSYYTHWMPLPEPPKEEK